MSLPARRLLLPVMTGAASLALVLGLAPARAATPGWRIVTTVGPARPVNLFQSAAATSAGDAWFSGVTCSPCASGFVRHLLVVRWNGTTWHRMTVPAVVAQGVTDTGALAAAASSASNAWVFGETAAATPEEGSPEAAQWNGSQWTATALPSWAYSIAADGSKHLVPAVFSASDVWLFSLQMQGSTFYAAHYDGTTWSQQALPGDPVAVSALGAADIWAVVITPQTAGLPPAQQQYLAVHWDGQSWQQVPFPDLQPAPGDILLPEAMAAVSASQIWVEALIETSSNQVTDLLLGWNGSSWTQVDAPLQDEGVSPAGVVQDGHGGVWLPQSGPAPKFVPYLYHYSGGQWTRHATPQAAGTQTQINGFAWIPGTRSVWAAAQSTDVAQGTQVAAVLKYGP